MSRLSHARGEDLMDAIAELVAQMTRAVVDRPEDVRVIAAPGVIATTYHVTVHPTDIGKALGKQGRIADAMRTIAKASAMRDRRKVYVDVMSGDNLGDEAVVHATSQSNVQAASEPNVYATVE
jgi:uncharacterized protein